MLNDSERKVLAYMQARPTEAVWGKVLIDADVLGAGGVYTVLSRMEKRGLLTVEQRKVADSKRPRSFYRVSAYGARVLETEQERDRLQGLPAWPSDDLVPATGPAIGTSGGRR